MSPITSWFVLLGLSLAAGLIVWAIYGLAERDD